MRFTELIEALAPPAGTLIKANFRVLGLGDPDELVARSPRLFLEKLRALYGGDECAARMFVYLVAGAMRERGFMIDPAEMLQIFSRDDADALKGLLAMVAEVLFPEAARSPAQAR